MSNAGMTDTRSILSPKSPNNKSEMEVLRNESLLVDLIEHEEVGLADITTRSEPLFIDHEEDDFFDRKDNSFCIESNIDNHIDLESNNNNHIDLENNNNNHSYKEDKFNENNNENNIENNVLKDMSEESVASKSSGPEELELVCVSKPVLSPSLSSRSSSWVSTATRSLQKRSLATLLDAIALQRPSLTRFQRPVAELERSQDSDLSAVSTANSVLDTRQVESDGDEEPLQSGQHGEQALQENEEEHCFLQPESTLRRTVRMQRKPSPHPQAYFTVDSRRMTTRYKRNARDRKLLFGIKQFNLDCSKGIEYLVQNGFLEKEDARGVARFLFREKRLSKRQIGKYIGAHDEFNQRVLKEFVQCHEFTHLILVQALRQFLWSFRLPGEAMQIDRVMESFAARYCEQNPSLFESWDTCYVLCFSIIMLNTALHNPSVRKKMSVDEFVKQNKGIDSGHDLPRDILELIYRSIKEEAFRIPTETHNDLLYTFFAPENAGWLLKQGGNWKSWKKRWFVLSDRVLYYFTDMSESVPKGIIPLENVRVRAIEETDNKNFCFEIFADNDALIKGCKTDSKGTVVQGRHKTYRMCASSVEERGSWVQSLQRSIRTHPFHDIILRKKANLRRNNLNKTLKSGQQQDLLDLSYKST